MTNFEKITASVETLVGWYKFGAFSCDYDCDGVPLFKCLICDNKCEQHFTEWLNKEV